MIEIDKSENCSGCNACYNICPVSCIEMISDEEGFWYPIFDKDDCIRCGKCIEVCPEINEFKNIRASDSPKAVAGWNKNLDIRNGSSSGGIFDALARYILDRDGIVYGAGYDEDLNVVHKGVRSTSGLEELRRSKYVQSDIGRTYRDIGDMVKAGEEVLFVGAPCQVSGLYKYLNKDYENLYTLDFICHGVPSPKFFRDYRDTLEEEYNSNIKGINFRDKDKGWNLFSMKVEFESGEIYRETLEDDSYLVGFLKDYTLRPSCYECIYTKLPRVADITLGDYWGVANKHIELDDDRGISLLLINTERGEYLLDKVKDTVEILDTDLDYAVANNPSVVKSVDKPIIRDAFFKDYVEGGFQIVRDRYLKGPSLTVKTKNAVRRKLGVVKRKVKKKIK